MSEQNKYNISEFVKLLEYKYSKFKIYLLYSEKNLRKYAGNLNNTYQVLEKLFTELYKFNSETDIYLRMHGYKEWIIVRIQGTMIFPTGILKEVTEPNLLFNISHKDNNVIIKMAIEKS